MRITLSMTIGELIETFETEFDARIIVDNKDNKLSTILFDISKARDKNVAISISPSTRIRSIEAMFLDSFGIFVQICNKLGYLAEKDSILASINENLEESIKDGVKLFYAEDENFDFTDEDSDSKSNKGTKSKSNSKIEKTEKNKRQLANKGDVKKEDIRIKAIKEKYLKYQKTEKYNDMKTLITELEVSSLELANREGDNKLALKRTIDETRHNAFNVAGVYKKKRLFFILVFGFISLFIFVGGAVISYSHRYYEKTLTREIDEIISRSTDNNSAMSRALLTEKQRALEEMKAVGIEKDIIIIVGLVFVVISSVFIVSLNKYAVTSTRLK